jgi:hypothetical protein
MTAADARSHIGHAAPASRDHRRDAARRRRGSRQAVRLAALALALAPVPAAAVDPWTPFRSRLDREDPERIDAHDISVLARPRPDYAPLGIGLDALGGLLRGETRPPARATGQAAAWTLLPSLQLEGQRTDNVFRSDVVKRSDVIARVTPRAVLESDWSRHAVSFAADGTFARYANTSGEDYDDYHAVADGRLDASEELQGFLRLVRAREHQERGGIDNPGLINGRLAVETTGAALGTIYEVEGIALAPRLQYHHIRYGLANGGVDTTGAGQQNHDEYLFDARASYEVVPGTRVFIQPSANRRSYVAPTVPGDVGHSSSGYEVLAGAVWNVSAVTLIDAGVGFLSQSFDDSRIAAVDGPSGNLTFVWNPLEAITVSAGAERRLYATTAIDFSNVLLTSGRIGVDLEAMHNLLFSVGFRAYDADFRGGVAGTPNRSDSGRIGSLAARYLLNEHVDFGLQYTYSDRSSNQPNLGYAENLIVVQANLKW